MYCPNCGNELSDHANFCSNCGNANISGNTSKKATEDSKESNQDKYSKYWFNKGVEFSESKEYERALYAYNQALTIDYNDPDTWNNKSFVLIKLGKYEEAINAGKIGVNLAPHDPVIWDTLRNAYLANNNPEKAAECKNKISNLPTRLPEKKSPSGTYGKGIGICFGLIVLMMVIAIIYNNWAGIAKSASSLLYGMIFLILLGGILSEGWKAVKH
jgi:tetratricopeptide (TPR) repeat protein